MVVCGCGCGCVRWDPGRRQGANELLVVVADDDDDDDDDDAGVERRPGDAKEEKSGKAMETPFHDRRKQAKKLNG
jgi:hypothetical protein